MSSTLFDKLWDAHVVREFDDGTALLYVDRIMLHERTGSIALRSLLDDGRSVANPRQVFATMDHIIDTYPGRGDATTMPSGGDFIRAMREGAQQFGITLFDIGNAEQGICHLVSAEQGIALPGLTLVCPDSHTCSLGALGCLAWGIGTSDCEQALSTEVLRVAKPRQMRIRLDGRIPPGVTAKDLVLHLIAKHGVAGAAGHAVEFAGSAIAELGVEGRLTICNMAVEFSAFTAVIAPDEKTLEYVDDRKLAPRGAALEAARRYWRELTSDPGARFDRELAIDCSAVRPMVSWGTNPGQSIAIDATVPSAADFADEDQRRALQRALEYMDIADGSRLEGLPIQAAFIGSCTNSRLSDLRAAAEVLRGRRVAPGVKAICVPGSTSTKRAAEAEGLDRVFTEAGFEWREAGCSLCFYAGGEGFTPGQRVISTTNRNFEGRQGPGVRTHIASPLTVAASAVAGAIAAADTRVL